MDEATTRVRLAFEQVAPEIRAHELTPEARLVEDLGLDRLAKWQVAVAIERIARVEIDDAKIDSATRVADFISLAVSDAPLPAQDGAEPVSDTQGSEKIDNDGFADNAAKIGRRKDNDSTSVKNFTDNDAPKDLAEELANLAEFFKK
ncbi:acyl carrier protein [Arcanobacterium wilhelmae]|uniref:Acyl carrier protein n=1 Tax=Arcanobacterium wilhelmae TaxID=1803177 RepID=A0ABT9NAH3_9ACTO|nr:hypothetical protein [Arcanobacterium wilhelmae]MDP9800211.1 acyl carrier protein [Arcanobacterium wilhelmae]WFN89651.1 hypothetical protein P8A24_05435 [Arcanobacterium wilhelmae]